jgi:hypothetical protein
MIAQMNQHWQEQLKEQVSIRHEAEGRRHKAYTSSADESALAGATKGAGQHKA